MQRLYAALVALSLVFTFTLGACEETTGPFIATGGIFVRVTSNGSPIEGVQVTFSSETGDRWTDTTAANGFAVRFPIAGGGRWEVGIAVPTGLRLRDDAANPAIVHVRNGESKVYVVNLVSE